VRILLHNYTASQWLDRQAPRPQAPCTYHVPCRAWAAACQAEGKPRHSLGACSLCSTNRDRHRRCLPATGRQQAPPARVPQERHAPPGAPVLTRNCAEKSYQDDETEPRREQLAPRRAYADLPLRSPTASPLLIPCRPGSCRPQPFGTRSCLTVTPRGVARRNAAEQTRRPRIAAHGHRPQCRHAHVRPPARALAPPRPLQAPMALHTYRERYASEEPQTV
jgi:hypothetical protein